MIEVLKKHFGFTSFKGNQEQIIQKCTGRQRYFCINANRRRKITLLPASCPYTAGNCHYYFPLIALMKNQVDAMRSFSEEDGVAHFLNSSLNKAAIAKVKHDIMEGKTKLLYVAPESLTKEENIQFLKKVNISFYAIDEAHCISEWGHDFRPEYRRIRPIINEIGTAPIMALTALPHRKYSMIFRKTWACWMQRFQIILPPA